MHLRPRSRMVKIGCRGMKPRSLGWLFPTESLAREGGFNSTLICTGLWGSCWAWGRAPEVVGEGFGWAVTSYAEMLCGSHSLWWDEFHKDRSILRAVFMLSLQTTGSQVDAHPFFRRWGQVCLGSWCSLVFASFPHRAPFAPVHPEGPGTQLQRGHCHCRRQVGLNWIGNESEMRDKETTQVLDRREQCASGYHDWSSPEEVPVDEVETRLSLLITFSCSIVRFSLGPSFLWEEHHFQHKKLL